uniref:Uncharacterized protein n=1 Tax=Populus trichocarpa TaxID=3694 RepID=U5FTJ1_POPTR
MHNIQTILNCAFFSPFVQIPTHKGYISEREKRHVNQLCGFLQFIYEENWEGGGCKVELMIHNCSHQN